jgi:hypothetical protein
MTTSALSYPSAFTYTLAAKALPKTAEQKSNMGTQYRTGRQLNAPGSSNGFFTSQILLALRVPHHSTPVPIGRP